MEEFELAKVLPELPDVPPMPARGRMGSQAQDEFQRAFEQAIGDSSLEDLMGVEDAIAKQTELEPDSRHTGTVAAVRRGDVFVALGGREQGCLPVRVFAEPPAPGSRLEVIVRRLNPQRAPGRIGVESQSSKYTTGPPAGLPHYHLPLPLRLRIHRHGHPSKFSITP